MVDAIETTHIFTALSEAERSKKYSIYVLEGGSGSGKTYDGIHFIMDYCRRHNFEEKRITIGRETYKDCIDTIAFDFFKRLKTVGWYDIKNHKFSHPQSYFLFGNQIDFTGWSTNGQPSKRQDVSWFNEAMENNFEIYQQYNQRTNDFTLLDYNPKFTDHWVYTNVCTRPDCFFLHSTLLQNPFLPDKQRKEILAYEPTAENIKNGTADDYMWKVYGLGLRTAQKGLIFKNVNWIDRFPENLNYSYGLDFGFTNDPTALVKLALDGNNNLFVELLCYEPIDNSLAISDMMNGLKIRKNVKITADCADKYNDTQMVSELNDLRWNIGKVNKGKGVNWRIGLLKKHKINIVHNINAKREAENYKWREINGILINEPVDKFNHMWDAVGYGYLGMMNDDDLSISRAN